MKIEDAEKIKRGEKPSKEPTIVELQMLLTGACLLDNGDIWCLVCNKPNECCECQTDIDELVDKLR